MKRLFRRKDIQRLIEAASENQGKDSLQLKRTLGATHLILLGIGATVGAGIFSLSGIAAAFHAGPGVIYSFIIGACLCALAGLCYAEMAAMVPVSGSTYTYSYATMGELIAWIMGWNLILEYAFNAATVCSSWSGYFFSLFHKTLGVPVSDTTIRLTKGPWELVTLQDGLQVSGILNLPASVIALLLGVVLLRGMKESTLLNNVMVVIKVTIVLVFIALGWSVIDSANWIADPLASGLAQLVPPQIHTMRGGYDHVSFGWPGVLTGAGVVFFAYIGFDAVSATAQECRNPTRDLPLGILGSLAICTVLYILMSLVMTGVSSYLDLGVSDPIAVGVDKIVAAYSWSPVLKKIFTCEIKLGALAGLTSVILVTLMAQSRILYAMAHDGLLPWFGRLHSKYSTPHIATLSTTVFVAVCAALMPMHLIGELVSIGTLLAFFFVCIGIPILRIKSPETPRPFKTPLYWIVAPAGALACLWVMSGLPMDTWIRLGIWLSIGLAVYFIYGMRKSKLSFEAPLLSSARPVIQPQASTDPATV